MPSVTRPASGFDRLGALTFNSPRQAQPLSECASKIRLGRIQGRHLFKS
jgi:hypothetical protein